MNNGLEVIPDAKKTFEQLVIDNENFVYSVVHKEFSKYSWSIKQDLFSAGKAGLVYAATKFNPTNYKNKFISYAVHWIRFYINEELRKMYPVKLNQNYIYKLTKIKKFVDQFIKKYSREPTTSEISGGVGMSEKVVNNILNVNNGEDFQFVSFQSFNKETTDDNTNESYIENKLVNEYIDQTTDDYNLTDYELKDLLETLKTKVSEKDYNIFIDRHLNDLSYSEIAKKYNLNFPSSAKYIIKHVESVCKELIS